MPKSTPVGMIKTTKLKMLLSILSEVITYLIKISLFFSDECYYLKSYNVLTVEKAIYSCLWLNNGYDNYISFLYKV